MFSPLWFWFRASVCVHSLPLLYVPAVYRTIVSSVTIFSHQSISNLATRERGQLNYKFDETVGFKRHKPMDEKPKSKPILPNQTYSNKSTNGFSRYPPASKTPFSYTVLDAGVGLGSHRLSGGSGADETAVRANRASSQRRSQDLSVKSQHETPPCLLEIGWVMEMLFRHSSCGMGSHHGV